MSLDEKPLPIGVGDIIDGRYELTRLLGRGGMGAVFAAQHMTLQTEVALKFLVDERSVDAIARFSREARVTAKLTSPHAIRVMDVATPADGVPYLVMELLHGKDLEALIRMQGALSVERAAGYLLQACDALAEAHALGVIHRDLKPGNVFLAQDRATGAETIKVLDFGLSKAMEGLDRNAASLSSTSAIMGSPAYMSPEQLRSAKHVDLRTDVWALGVIFYELVTGAYPFRYESFSELLVAIARDPHVPAQEVRPALPREVAKIIDRALAKDREQRFPDVRSFASALAPFAAPADRERLKNIERRAHAAPRSSDPVIAQAPVSGVASTVRAVTTTHGASPAITAPTARRRTLPWITGAASLALAGAALALLTTDRGNVTPASANANVVVAASAASASPPASPTVSAAPSNVESSHAPSPTASTTKSNTPVARSVVTPPPPAPTSSAAKSTKPPREPVNKPTVAKPQFSEER